MKPVAGPGPRGAASGRRTAAEATAAAKPIVAAEVVASPEAAAAAAAVAGSTSVFDDDAGAHHRFSVQLVDGIFRIAVVFELDESVAVLYENVAQVTESLEELFQIPFGRSFGDPSDIHPRPHSKDDGNYGGDAFLLSLGEEGTQNCLFFKQVK